MQKITNKSKYVPVLKRSDSVISINREMAMRINFKKRKAMRLHSAIGLSSFPVAESIGKIYSLGIKRVVKGTICVMASATTAAERNTEFRVNSFPN